MAKRRSMNPIVSSNDMTGWILGTKQPALHAGNPLGQRFACGLPVNRPLPADWPNRVSKGAFDMTFVSKRRVKERGVYLCDKHSKEVKARLANGETLDEALRGIDKECADQMVKSTKELGDWVVGMCPRTYLELMQQGYTYNEGTDFEGWELYDKRGHHVDNLYFDEDVPFFKGWPKSWDDIADEDEVVRAMVVWYAKNGSLIKHGLFGQKSLYTSISIGWTTYTS